MTLDKQSLDTLRGLLHGEAKKIVLLCHTNPDGDTIGAALAWRSYLETLGHTTCCIAPNRYPYFLEWMRDINHVGIFKEDQDGALARSVAEAELIFCIDFNQVTRLEALTEVVEANTTAPRILIDHHLNPPVESYTLLFSDPQACSTSYLVFELITALAGTEAICEVMAESLYVGIMTDTGNFSFSHLTPELFRAVAVLIEAGIHIPTINNAVYNSYSEDRVRLLGHILNRKMTILHKHKAAYITLTEEEMRRFNFKQGDSEGFVNYPLSIRDVTMSVIFIATRKFIRVSLRSRGEVDVNLFARRYFQGGGHRNAAGGKSFISMQETIQKFQNALDEYFAEEQSK